MLDADKTDLRCDRHHITQEDFTPQSVVDDMLMRLPDETFTDFSKSVLDPSCGIGNFLVAILERRLEHCENQDDAVKAMRTLFGVELMADNVEECRNRLYDMIIKKFPAILDDEKKHFYLRSIVRNRIQWHDSLDFDYDHWKQLKTTPCEKHETISFHERKDKDDEFYPMWHKKEPKQLELF